MGELMGDALGIGLAATQVGTMHRVLVYRVEPDSPVNALVNPEIEWSSKESEVFEEGCLSLRGVLVDVERPIHVRVRARDEYGDEQLIEASGLEARVIQHEMDHLDGVLILDRTSRDQRKEAMRILARPEEPPTPSRLERRLPRHVGVRGRRAAAPRRRRPHAGAGRHAARPAARPRPGARRAADRRESRASSAIDVDQPESINDDAAHARIAAAAPDAVVVCAFGALIGEPLLDDFAPLNVHPSLLPRWRGAAPIERAIMAGDSETGVVDHAPRRRGSTAGPVCLRRPIRSTTTTRTARSRRGSRSWPARCWRGRWTSSRRSCLRTRTA